MVNILIDRAKKLCDIATPGPWAVWPGHGYIGGGEDLCIGAGNTWIANMENRYCVNYARHICEETEGPCSLRPDMHICTLDGDITAEQAADAQFIAESRTLIPELLAEVKTLTADRKKLLTICLSVKPVLEKLRANLAMYVVLGSIDGPIDDLIGESAVDYAAILGFLDTINAATTPIAAPLSGAASAASNGGTIPDAARAPGPTG